MSQGQRAPQRRDEARAPATRERHGAGPRRCAASRAWPPRGAGSWLGPWPALLFGTALLLLSPAGARAEVETPDAASPPLPEPSDATPAERPPLHFDVTYDVRVLPTERAAHVRIRLQPQGGRVHRLTFQIDPARHLHFVGSGDIESEGTRVVWTPPAEGGRLEYLFRIDHLRDERRYDARCAENWAMFRGDDLVPQVRASFDDGASSRARLHLRLPEGWKAALPYEAIEEGVYRVDHPERSFDRPSGWMLVGRIQTLRAKIHGMRVALAAPHKSAFRRHDTLALLRWTLPELEAIVGTLPQRLLIVGAGDPMWRGGLSGPASLYLHADRPLIEDDMTSPALHELIHTVMRIRAGEDGDWVVEGLAELYSLELLARSRTISQSAYRRALGKLAEKGEAARELRVARADGRVAARGARVLKSLDDEIRRRSDGQRSLDDVVRYALGHRAPMTTAAFIALVKSATGLELDDFFAREVLAEPAETSAPPPPARP